MDAVDRFLTTSPPGTAQVAHVARTISLTDQRLADHEVVMWGLRQLLDIDLRARAEAAGAAVVLELKLLSDGLTLAAGNPVAQELVLRHVQDTNTANRRMIERRLGS